MKALVLNRFPLASTPYAQWLGRDVETYLITSAKALSSDPAQRQRQLADYREVVVLDDYSDNPLIEYEALRLQASHHFDQIIAMSEFDLIRAARLRVVGDVPGQDVKSAVAYRDKARMKEVLRAQGIAVADHMRVTNATDLIQFADRTAFPLIVKPRMGAASVGVNRMDSADDLVAYLASEPAFRGDGDAGLIAERYIENQLYHVDGVVVDGEVVLCWPAEMSSTLGLYEGAPIVSSLLAAEDPLREPLQDVTRAVLDALPTPSSAIFHAEVFRTPDDELLLNEIACRIGGGRIRAVIKLAFGVDLNEYYLRSLGCDGPPPRPAARPSQMAGQILFPPLPGRLAAAPSACPVEGAGLSYTHQVGDTLSGAASSVDALLKVTVVGATREDVLVRTDEVRKWYAESVVINPLGAAGAARRPAV